MHKSHFRKQIIFFCSILLLTAFTLAGSGCHILKKDKKTVAEKKQEKTEKKAAIEYEKARKKHLKNQSKSTKEMMKQTRKQASKYNKPRKRGFFSNKKCD
jgi:hypothetical protein